MAYLKEKEQLISKILRKPRLFTKEEETQALNQLDFGNIRNLMKSIYDADEDSLREMSDARKGSLAIPNKIAAKYRHKKYYRKVKAAHRVDNPKKANKVILAEGDSWFQFPFLVKDIIRWLIEDRRNAIYSIAYAGDWLTNIIYDGEYISELAVHQPDAFLISGGGNDLLGNSRLAVMLKLPEQPSINPSDYVRERFYSYVLTLKLMYRMIFQNIRNRNQYDKMVIITQGYDYPIPRRPRFVLKRPFNYFLTKLIGSGQWLAEPMDIVGIPNKLKEQQDNELRMDIIRYMIDSFNEMFIEVTEHFENVFHVDCRGLAKDENDWFDEIHLRSKNFRKVSKVYSDIIHTRLGQHEQKVYVVNSKKYDN
ncbi:MAG: hypothetical protein AAFX87_23905 [Bacteroidota bacterium]